MSNVVLLAINSKYVHSSLSVWCLTGGVSRYARLPHDVRVVEATIHQRIDDIMQLIVSHNPDIVGISTYIWNAKLLPDLLMQLRQSLPSAVLVLGGPEASHNAEYWLTQGADYVLRGEGERSFPALLDALTDSKSNLETIPGLCRMRDGRMYVVPDSGPSGDWADPYTDAYFDTLNGRIAYIETSRGCPFQCAFCLSGQESVRFLPLETALERLHRLSQTETGTIKLVDRTFNSNPERAYELFKAIIALDTPCCFHFEVAADLFDERTLTLLATAPPGRLQMEAGLQSFDERALAAVSRKTDLCKAEENIRALLRARNIHLHVDLIAGLPYETLLQSKKSFDRAYALGTHTLQLGFLKLLHGSKLREHADQLGIRYDAAPPYKITDSPWLSAKDLLILRHTENALQHTYNKGRFLSALDYVLTVSGLRPFELYRTLGEAAPNHGTPLEIYAGQVYEICAALPNVDAGILRDKLTCDWLSMVKGKNKPPFLINKDRRRKLVIEKANKLLDRSIDRDEAAVLSSGKGVFVDTETRDPVTGLYRLHYVAFR